MFRVLDKFRVVYCMDTEDWNLVEQPPENSKVLDFPCRLAFKMYNLLIINIDWFTEEELTWSLRF